MGDVLEYSDDPQRLRPAEMVLALSDERARDGRLSGGKAAALARAAAAGLPVLPGFVVTTAAVAAVDETGDLDPVRADLRAAWEDLSGGDRPLVVRSSSTAEDQGEDSMAGRFESVVGVRGWDTFRDAFRTVLDSRRSAAEGQPALAADHPIAVLVQPTLDASVGGVLFGVDPVTGRSDRIVVSAVRGGPERIVSGETEATRYVLDRSGAEQALTESPDGATLSSRQLRELAELAARAEFLFRGPQDVEWGLDGEGRLWLLQSRPVTTDIAGVPTGPVLGPGPVAETFPEPLSTLEQDLWVEPLRRALREALELTGAASAEELAASPVALSMDGRVAVDLTLFGEASPRQSSWARLDPRPKLRRIRSAWRVGRLRAALPGLAEDLVSRTDAQLSAVPALDSLTDRQLVATLRRTREALASVHAHEVLVGLLVDPDAPRLTGTSVALRVLDHARQDGMPDDHIIAAHPVVLALTPPRIAATATLPDAAQAPPWKPDDDSDRAALLREALRLRIRWLQELGARTAWELGERLNAAGRVNDPAVVRHFHLDGLEMAVRGRAVPWHRDGPELPPARDPLPARFRLSRQGDVIPIRTDDDAEGGTGAGGGHGSGPVTHDQADPPQGSVLVVRTLDPQLATLLSRLAGIVAETGNVLAHVAILARENSVPTVVGLSGALERFPEGCTVEVNGTTGDVRRTDGDQEADE